MNARERFEQTRNAVKRLNEVHVLLMYGLDDWTPERIRTPGKVSDPTANQAIRNVDVIPNKLDALKVEEKELEAFIGETLQVMHTVRKCFGDVYANLLEWRYIDCLRWEDINERCGIKRQYGNYLLNIAFDWIDSVGLARLKSCDADL